MLFRSMVATRPLRVGAPFDTLSSRVIALSAERAIGDSSRGEMQRRLPNSAIDTVQAWSSLSGIETERQLLRPADGQVVFRERSRRLVGRGWVPPHDIGDTVPLRVEVATVERLVDSATAALILNFPRRGERLISANARDTVGIHYKEWHGDTLILRQVRRSGWRDELRTVWRDSLLKRGRVHLART